MNSFVSTSSNPDVAFMHLDTLGIDKTLERVLFEIDADPKDFGVESFADSKKIGLKAFADISKISYFQQENEILMMLGSVFRLNDIYLDDKQIWHIQMTLCNDNVGDLKKTFDHMKNQYGSMDTRLLLFANVLIDMAHFDDAEKYLCRLLKQLPPDHRDIPKCYHALGKVSCEKGDYDLSLCYFEKGLEILKKSTPKDSRIGCIHNGMGEERILPAGHACLGNTYNNLGNVYYYLKDCDQALEKYKLSYEIFRKSLKPHHPSIARALKNIGVAYEVKKNFKEAKKYYENALDIWKCILSSSHPDLIEIKKDIGRASSKIEKRLVI